MREREIWELFFATGLPQAYTFCKACDRRKAKERASRAVGRKKEV